MNRTGTMSVRAIASSVALALSSVFMFVPIAQASSSAVIDSISVTTRPGSDFGKTDGIPIVILNYCVTWTTDDQAIDFYVEVTDSSGARPPYGNAYQGSNVYVSDVTYAAGGRPWQRYCMDTGLEYSKTYTIRAYSLSGPLSTRGVWANQSQVVRESYSYTTSAAPAPPTTTTTTTTTPPTTTTSATSPTTTSGLSISIEPTTTSSLAQDSSATSSTTAAVPNGEALVTIGGVEVKSSTAVEGNTVTVSAGGVEAEVSTASTPTDSINTKNEQGLVLASGEIADVSIDGLQPNSEMEVVIYSTPRQLGTLLVNEFGELVASIQIPSDMEPGPHTLVLTGLDKFGKQIELKFGLVVYSPDSYIPIWVWLVVGLLAISLTASLVSRKSKKVVITT
jgi:hypothetical protein